MNRALQICCALLLSCLIARASSAAAPTPVEKVLPPAFGHGWAMESKPVTYSPENLYQYIDGEAELYLPYGFEKAASVTYVRPGSKDNGIVANIFKMGSLLDAFGIYGNYRSPATEQVKLGAEGFIEESELLFYQGPYFVQLMASGSVSQDQPSFMTCASAISRNLPYPSTKPAELQFLQVPGLVARSEKYYAQGLLGQAFFGKGLTAEVKVKGAPVKAILMLAGSPEKVRHIFGEYEKYLKESKVTPAVSTVNGAKILHVTDPLYKGMVLKQSGPYIAGASGLKDPHDGDELVAQLIGRLPGK